MLSEILYQNCQAFKQILEQLQAAIAAADVDRVVVTAKVAQAQQVFQHSIFPLETTELDPALLAQFQSCRTEMHKQIRLLGMDVMLLQAARQSANIQQRQAQMGDRVQMLIGYCKVLLGINQSGDELV